SCSLMAGPADSGNGVVLCCFAVIIPISTPIAREPTLLETNARRNRVKKKTHFISALGTPLTDSGELHAAGLEAHLDDQWTHGIGGVLVAGTMGMMQLLTDETYRQLALRASEFSKGRGEVMVGAGDCSFHRT